MTIEKDARFAMPKVAPELLLKEGLPELRARAESRRLSLISAEFMAWQAPAEPVDLAEGRPQQQWQLVRFLAGFVDQQLDAMERLRKLQIEFSTRHAQLTGDDEREENTLAFARALGASNWQLAVDGRAFKRWFGLDAVVERCQRQIASAQQMVRLGLECLGWHANKLLLSGQRNLDQRALQSLWLSLRLEPVTRRAVRVPSDQMIDVEALRTLRRGLVALPRVLQADAISDTYFECIYRWALKPAGAIWLCVECIRCLLLMARDSQIQLLVESLTRYAHADEIFLRRQIVAMLPDILRSEVEISPQQRTAIQDLLHSVSGMDPSPFVRQAAATALGRARTRRSLPLLIQLAKQDDVRQVRASALLALSSMAVSGFHSNQVANAFEQVMEAENDEFVLRTVIHVVVDTHDQLLDAPTGAMAAKWDAQMNQALELLIKRTELIPVKRWAQQGCELLWARRTTERRELFSRLNEVVRAIAPGSSGKLAAATVAGVDEVTLGRLFAVIAQQDFGLELKRRTIYRGFRFRFALWRFLHELRHPSSEKREAFNHLVGRRFSGAVQAPSGILAEVSATTVPGEPLHLEEEDGWRPYLPLLDHALLALRLREPVRIFTPQGLTLIEAPPSLFERVRAWWRLTWNYAHIAHLRNWRKASSQPREGYLHALDDLGFKVSFCRHDAAAETVQKDGSVQGFFDLRTGATTAAFMPLPLIELWNQLSQYFVSLYQNSLRDLLLFLLIASALFFGRHLWKNLQMHRARKRMPLVIGGWGSRGKSGTERLKAALMNSLGYHVMAKTTGCEAMVLHGHEASPLRELFLFRPFDKATIWEQLDVMKLGSKMNADVFLWECMGLTPSYVEVLQQQWMRDDLSTITNAYPDHEDLQGPAGINIPEVMTGFIPSGTRLLTAEQAMYPVLEQGAQESRTSIRQVGWLEEGLIPPDILERFPYQEHPSNIALVTALADEMGVDPDFTWKEIAERVVPDLGSLKQYPVSHRDGRRLQYVLGNSANERLATLGNWRRMGFDESDPVKSPDVWISTLINNRDDRVARSRVFASMLVNDISADLHVLIGTNIDGFRYFVREAWDERVEDISLITDDDRTPVQVVMELAAEFRIPRSTEELKARLAAMLGQAHRSTLGQSLLDIDSETALQAALEQAEATESQIAAALNVAARLVQEQKNLADLCQQAEAGGDLHGVTQALTDLLWNSLNQRMVSIDDAHASAETILEAIVAQTPPGYLNRIMGMQNIKGTGLGHVYAWEDWLACHAATQLLLSGVGTEIDKGLAQLSSMENFNSLCLEYLDLVLLKFRESALAQSESRRAALQVVESRVAKAKSDLEQADTTVAKRGRLPRFVDAVEDLIDIQEAVKRRKQADRIYRDLVNERISHGRASTELRRATQEQKGGWLWERVKPLLPKFSNPKPVAST